MRFSVARNKYLLSTVYDPSALISFLGYELLVSDKTSVAGPKEYFMFALLFFRHSVWNGSCSLISTQSLGLGIFPLI